MNDNWIIEFKDGTEVVTSYDKVKLSLNIDPDEIEKAYPEKLKEKFSKDKPKKEER